MAMLGTKLADLFIVTKKMPTKKTLVTALVMFSIFGILNMAITGRLHIKQPWIFLENLAAGILAYLWYYHDSKERNKKSHLIGIGIFLYSLLMIPIYLFISRGGTKGLKAFLQFVLFLFALLITFAIGGLIGKTIAPQPIIHLNMEGSTLNLNVGIYGYQNTDAKI